MTKRYKKVAVHGKKLQQMCMVQGSESMKKTGERIYKMLDGRYKENIKLLETQQKLMDRHNKSIGSTDIILAEQRERLKKLNDSITQNDRQLIYNNQLYHGDNKWIRGLKISAVFLIIALIGVMILSAFKTLKKK